MSVYRPRDKAGKLAPIYRYDFVVDGRRFSGSTGATARGEAKRVELARKGEARAELAAAKRRRAAPMMIDVAAARFWTEVGQHYRGGAGKTFDASLAWIVSNLGPTTILPAITSSKVAELVARRRGEGVKPATVNRTVTEPLRRVMNRARDLWEQDVPPIKWGKHLLEEPKERVRSATDVEEEKLLAAMPEDYRPLVAFALASGCRLAECVGLTWAAVDWGGRQIAVLGKGEKPATVPLTPELRDILWPLQGRHKTAVFCYRAAATVHRNREVVREEGRWYPITYEGMKTAWRRADRDVADFRFHDWRHTRATRLLRSSGNLKLVQKLLRHEDITTTAKYAHADDDDLREAMEHEAESRRNPHASHRKAG